MNSRAGCGHPFTVTLDDSLLEDPCTRDDDGTFQPGAICDSALTSIASLCGDSDDELDQFIRKVIGENVQAGKLK